MIYSRLHDLNIQPNVRRLLLQTIENERIHHAYLFYGAQGSGKLATALTFAQHMLCINSVAEPCQTCSSCFKMKKLAHPDLTLMFPAPIKDGKADPSALNLGVEHYSKNPFTAPPFDANLNYFVETMREIKTSVKYAPSESPRRVILLHEIEKMNDATANAFLKLLEEPPEHTTLIMTTSNIQRILPTIRSRCQQFYCAPLTEEQLFSIAQKIQPDATPNDLPIKLANGNARRMFEFYSIDLSALRDLLPNFLRYAVTMKPLELNQVIDAFKKKSRAEVVEFLDLMLFWFRDSQILALKEEIQNPLINIDLDAELNKFTSRFPNLDFTKIVDEIELAKTYIRQNVHIELALNDLAVRLHTQIVMK